MLRPSKTSLAPESTPLWINFSILSFAFLDTTGPISAFGSSPPETLNFFALSTISGILLFCCVSIQLNTLKLNINYHSLVSPTKTAVLNAIHL